MRNGLIAAALLLACLATAGCIGNEAAQRTNLHVVPAGSLVIPFEGLEAGFEASHPGVDVMVEPHGSIQAIRQVTDLHRAIDVVAVADESLIPDLMYRPMEGGGGNYTDGYERFATNRMVIAYTNASRYADEIDGDTWYKVLSRPGVRVGISNPMLDAAGYRALMVLMLAEGFYHNDTIFASVIGSHFDPAILPEQVNGTMTVTLPEVLKPAGGKVAVRDGSIFLMSLLGAGGIDYAFEYRNVAEANGYRWVDLPPEIDLSSASHADDYAKAIVVLGFQRFSSIGRERTGRPIVYAITIPHDAPNPVLAHEFEDYVLSQARAGGRGWPTPLEGG